MIWLLADFAQMPPLTPFGVALSVVGGVLAVLAACRNWDWFFTWPPAPVFVSLFGRAGARVIYFFLGVLLVVIGGLEGFGVIQ